MNKILLLVFVFAAAWWLIKRLRGKDAGKDAPGRAPEQMVICGHCGLYLPQREAIPAGDKFFCCAEHQRRAP
jgi:uncharacterized protein